MTMYPCTEGVPSSIHHHRHPFQPLQHTRKDSSLTDWRHHQDHFFQSRISVSRTTLARACRQHPKLIRDAVTATPRGHLSTSRAHTCNDLSLPAETRQYHYHHAPSHDQTCEDLPLTATAKRNPLPLCLRTYNDTATSGESQSFLHYTPLERQVARSCSMSSFKSTRCANKDTM